MEFTQLVKQKLTVTVDKTLNNVTEHNADHPAYRESVTGWSESVVAECRCQLAVSADRQQFDHPASAPAVRLLAATENP